MQRKHFKFAMANDSLFVIEDKYPEASSVEPIPSWKRYFSTERRRLQSGDEDEDNWVLIISNDGYWAIYQQINDILEVIWSPFEVIDEVINITNVTSTATTTKLGIDKRLDEKSEEEDLVWLWVILGLLIFVCIVFILIYEYKKRDHRDFIAPTAKQIVENLKEDRQSVDYSDNEGEDGQIMEWITATGGKYYGDENSLESNMGSKQQEVNNYSGDIEIELENTNIVYHTNDQQMSTMKGGI